MLTQLKQLAAPYTEQCSVQAAFAALEASTMPTEAHLQALWYDDSLRPEMLTLEDGTPVVLLEKGIWNHGEGPDFKNALVAMKGCLQRGDIEVHCKPHDWDIHRHAQNPAYQQVILHVTWEASPPAKTLPPQVPTLALKPFFERHRTSVDFSRLSFVHTRGAQPPCQRLMALPGAVDRLLQCAGYHRFLQKAQHFVEKSQRAEPFQAFYEGLFRAMGYQRNADAFLRLAKEVPFERLRDLPVKQRFAVLAGVAGLLPNDRRDLWDLWWIGGCPPPIEPFTWDLRALRPQNHPYRRLAGGVGILNAIAHLLELPLDQLSEGIQAASTLLVEELDLKGTPIGASRANALINNLFIPYRIATGTCVTSALQHLPGEAISAPMREVWFHLTGTVTGLPKDGLRQQGLLQIDADFCHNDHILCATCPIPFHA